MKEQYCVEGRCEIMTDNTLNVNGVDIYTHDIYYYADKYIQEELEIEKVNIDNKYIVRDNFNDMLFYIADNIPKPSNDDIELLDNIFNIYKKLCTKYGVLPTLEIFSELVKINRATFTDWKNGEYRSSTHSNTVKNWFDTCKSLTVDRLTNKGGTDANLIFIAKAAYGMAETMPMQADKNLGLPEMSRQEVHKAFIERKKPEIEFTEDGSIIEGE